MKKLKISSMISYATLFISVVTLWLVLKKPAPVSQPVPAATAAASVQSFETKIEQLGAPKQAGQEPAQVRLTSEEVSAAFAQAAGALPVTPQPQVQQQPGQPPALNSPDASLGEGAPEVKDYQVNFDGDIARGQFVTKVGGKDVYVTLAGHLGSKDGYATFEPTEFKVGDLSVPVSLVNDALQKRLAEQRDRLRLPDGVGDMKVINGELVLTQK